MQDWQAALAAYIILDTIAATSFAPAAVAIAWGIAITELIAFQGSGPVQSLISLIQQATPAKQGASTNAGT